MTASKIDLMRFKTILPFLFFIISLTGTAQEVLTGMQFNPVVEKGFRELEKNKSPFSIADTIPINLPFFDDFSKSQVFPSSDKWSDRYGFINSDFPINPVNFGVVTLDAINDSGSMYPEAVPGPQTFIADHLTSRYIRLDSTFTPVPKSLSPADSAYFSFYYQPQGRGSSPGANDSLVLQFLRPAFDSINLSDTLHIPAAWRNVWSSGGMTLDTFYVRNNLFFKQVMIPVKSQFYFNKYFRFRFFNYVSLASISQGSWQSNCCEWNIDNVQLNTGRSFQDTVHREIRFIDRPPSMLMNYQSMPYKQYCDNPTEEMIDTIAVVARNRDTVNHQI
ncbi:MAG: hypothetical protein WCL00_06515, partial [Bacteroidota bacterium]